MFQSPPMTPLSSARFIIYEVRSVLLAHCSAEVSPLPGVAASRKTGLAKFSFDLFQSSLVPHRLCRWGRDRTKRTIPGSGQESSDYGLCTRDRLSGGGALIQREVEKTFCSDPVAEQGINTVQTEEGKAMHLENVSC